MTSKLLIGDKARDMTEVKIYWSIPKNHSFATLLVPKIYFLSSSSDENGSHHILSTLVVKMTNRTNPNHAYDLEKNLSEDEIPF